uniref:Variant surface glycoprotein 1168 n=1 Tax=Trypanosoma brucei TaxID=5691 RepID=M4SZH1_9TRYP|nr:variant surface glycoprotein 1168 [Trypanosoma brucei]
MLKEQAQPKMKLVAILAAAIMHSHTADSTPSSDETEALTAVTEACSEIVLLEQLLEEVWSRLNEAVSSATRLRLEAETLYLVAEHSRGWPQHSGYLLLSQLAATRARKQQLEINLHSVKLKQAEAALQSRIVLAKIGLRLKDSKRTAGKAISGCTGTDFFTNVGATTAGKCTLEFEPPAAPQKCDVNTGTAAQISKIRKVFDKLENIKLTNDDSLKPQKLTAKAYAVGTVATTWGPATNPVYCAGTIGNEPTTATTGLTVSELQPTAPEPQRTQALEGEKPNSCVKPGSVQTDLITTATAAAHAVCQARGARPQIFATVTGGQTEQLLQDPDFKRLAVLIATGRAPKDDDDKTQKAALKAIFGSEKPDLHKSHLANLSQTQITLNHGDRPQTLTLAQISTTADASDAIALFFNQAMRKQTTSESAKEADVKTKDKCKADTKENKCKKDKDCEHKDGKCKVKERVKV